MSNIVIIVDDSTTDARLLIRLQRVTGRGLAEIRNAVRQGEPIFEREIFDANYDAHASMIRAIVDCLENASVASRIYEIPEGEMMASCPFVEKHLISTAELGNLLSQADTELRRQLGE